VTDPQVSVVIPCRNAGPYLGEQLDALTRQHTSLPWEVVVVDNGSTDDTVAIAHSYADRLALRVVDCAVPGPSAARNAGAHAAESDLLLFCDGDDVVGDGWLAALAEALEQHECVTGPLDVDTLNVDELADSRGHASAPGTPHFGAAFDYPRSGNMGVRRDTLARVGWFDDTVTCLEDQELGLRLWLAGVAVHFVPEAVVHYRYRSDARSIWAQGLRYGEARVRMSAATRSAGLPSPSRVAGWRSWAWLVLHLPRMRTASGRLLLLWVLASRIGHVVGSLRLRTLYL
jgi:glycosyltransferase involved in cell wall biosynthesis